VNSRLSSEFGDFQTPPQLASAICNLLRDSGVTPETVIEPTCGRGAFLKAAAEVFPQSQLIGADINPIHLRSARESLSECLESGQLELHKADFFDFPWSSVLAAKPGPWLVLGNPPWVTNAKLGVLKSRNLPSKTNRQGGLGIDAITGKSNFDISEWMLHRYF
jgi:predicted RNA methylase